MELKKTSKADLESKKQIFLLIALIIALSGTIFAIEYKTWDEEEEEAKKDDFTYEEEEIMITREQKPPPPEEPPPPPPEVPEEIEIKENEEDLTKKVETISAETDEEEMIEEESSEEAYTYASVMPLLGGCKNEACTQSEIMKFIAKNFKYPEIAKANGVEGRVVVWFVVGKDGKVGQVELAKDQFGEEIGSSGNRHLDKAAIEAVKKFNLKNAPKFSPAMNVSPKFPRGKKVNLRYTVPVKCTLG
ncbi:energy transducer TonB [Flavobacteriales bacterium]|nr:energy transducer TonB [Flavobacteriales bacterium]